MKLTDKEGSENSEKVIVDLFGSHGQPVPSNIDGNGTSKDEIDNGNMK